MLITPLVLTFNEAPNLDRALQSLTWAEEVVVMDSFSTDETLTIASRYRNVRVVQRTFDNHVEQWNAGLAACSTEWVLSLDADYVLTEELIEELRAFQRADEEDDVVGFMCRFEYCVFGRPLKRSLYPPRAVLFKRGHCGYTADGHTQRLRAEGAVGWLAASIRHDDRKPLTRWLSDQDRYAMLEVEKLTASSGRRLSLQDRTRRLVVVAPVAVFVLLLFGKGLVFNGWAGWIYVCQRTMAEMILSLRLAQRRLSDMGNEGWS